MPPPGMPAAGTAAETQELHRWRKANFSERTGVPRICAPRGDSGPFMSRIQQTFGRLAKNGKRALIPFITAGDPDPKLTGPLMHELVNSGADVIELGVPFSDPMADGPVIQRASERALRHHVGLAQVLQLVTEFRARDGDTPVVLMGYANPIEA